MRLLQGADSSPAGKQRKKKKTIYQHAAKLMMIGAPS